jgi:Uma2 family endonuclease
MSTSLRITVAQYDEMIARGDFEPREDHHVELIEGEVVPMSPIGPVHGDFLEILTEWSYEVRPRAEVKIRVQDSLGIPELDSVPEPDLYWAGRRDYRVRRPEASDIWLLIEVSESSLAKDLGRKARLYARAGIADYWIINVAGRTVEVRREPRDGIYERVQSFRPGEMIPLLAFPEIAFPVAILFPPDTD